MSCQLELSEVHPLIERLKESDQDHEFYPTTNEILRALVRDLESGPCAEDYRYRGRGLSSVLDIGAGNGKVLLELRGKAGMRELHAIEKSSILCRELDSDILVVGTDFAEQSLLSKEVDVIFCNPPYSEFEAWTEKIIRQACSHVIYLVIPQRWEKSIPITDAIRFRKAKVHKVGSFDFEDAEDRQARAKVQLLRITIDQEQSDPFELFFDEQFSDLIAKFNAKKKTGEESEAEENDKKANRKPYQSLVAGPNYPDAIVNLYRAEMAHIQSNYQLVSQLDADLLRELEIEPKKIMGFLKARLSGLRNEYWMELFSRLESVTNRLTSGSRKKMLDTLHKHVAVDFTVPNIYEVVVWVIKNANHYIESQLIDVYELMIDKANVQMYKSNKKVWIDERWRYNREEERQNSHFALDYRIVTHQVGGIRYGCLGSDGKGLEERACDFVGDLLTIAYNLGFSYDTSTRSTYLARWSHNAEALWQPGKPVEFCQISREPLLEARAFKNRNLHLRFNQRFILALNVEFGRLKGWLKSGEQAADELQDPEAAAYFNSNVQIGSDNPALLLTA